jgi:KDO2-lipid IV(A) lauroyltransferase
LLNSAKYLPGETSADDALMTGKWLLFFRSTKTKPRRTAASCQLRHFASQQIIVIRSLRDPPAGQHVRGRAHAPARGANGQIDTAGTMQTITTVVEGWVCEHPEQWLWVYRRWRERLHCAAIGHKVD